MGTKKLKLFFNDWWKKTLFWPYSKVTLLQFHNMIPDILTILKLFIFSLFRLTFRGKQLVHLVVMFNIAWWIMFRVIQTVGPQALKWISLRALYFFRFQWIYHRMKLSWNTCWPLCIATWELKMSFLIISDLLSKRQRWWIRCHDNGHVHRREQ